MGNGASLSNDGNAVIDVTSIGTEPLIDIYVPDEFGEFTNDSNYIATTYDYEQLPNSKAAVYRQFIQSIICLKRRDPPKVRKFRSINLGDPTLQSLEQIFSKIFGNSADAIDDDCFSDDSELSVRSAREFIDNEAIEVVRLESDDSSGDDDQTSEDGEDENKENDETDSSSDSSVRLTCLESIPDALTPPPIDPVPSSSPEPLPIATEISVDEASRDKEEDDVCLIAKQILHIEQESATSEPSKDCARLDVPTRQFVQTYEQVAYHTITNIMPWIHFNKLQYQTISTELARFQYLHLVHQTLVFFYTPFKSLLTAIEFPLDELHKYFETTEEQIKRHYGKCMESRDSAHIDKNIRVLFNIVQWGNIKKMEESVNNAVGLLRFTADAGKTCAGIRLKLTDFFTEYATMSEYEQIDVAFDDFVKRNANNLCYLTFLIESSRCEQNFRKIQNVFLPSPSTMLRQTSFDIAMKALSAQVVKCVKDFPLANSDMKMMLNATPLVSAVEFGASTFLHFHINKQLATRSETDVWHYLQQLKTYVSSFEFFIDFLKTCISGQNSIFGDNLNPREETEDIDSETASSIIDEPRNKIYNQNVPLPCYRGPRHVDTENVAATTDDHRLDERA